MPAWNETSIAAMHQFLIALSLAWVEIEIEGPHGWAEKLPTWRWGPPWWLRLSNGKPLTGYHLAFNALILAFLHLPFTQNPSLEAEFRALSVYMQLAFTWDFLWFVLNPAYGLKNFGPGRIWWFKNWLGPVPVDYPAGALSALFLAWVGGILPERALELALQLPLIAAACLLVSLLRRRTAPDVLK